MSKAIDSKGQPYNRLMMIVVLLVGTFCTVLNQTILATAFPTLMKAFNISTSTVQWLTTGFLLVNGIMIPVSAWLSNRFNSKWLYISSMAIFEIGTIMAWAAPSFAFLLSGRLIQAVGVGISMPLLQNIMLSIFPPDKRGAAMGMAGIVIGVAPAIGPTLSGWIIDTWQWRDLFGMIIPIVALVLLAAFFFMKPVIETSRPKLDWLSLALSTAGFGALLYGFSSVGDDGWGSRIVLSCLIIGLILIVLFVWRQLTMKTPFLQLRVFSSSTFTIATALSSVVMIAMVGVEMIVPLYLQIVHHMSALHSGLTLLPGALMMAVMSPITGRAFDRIGAKRLSIAGLFLLTAGTLSFVMITQTTPVIYITILYALRMFGISMVMMPATTAGMNALPTNLIAHGTAVNNTVRQVASSIGTAILISILSNVTNNQMPNQGLLKSSPLAYQVKAFNATMSGYHAAFWIAVAFCAAGFVIAFFMKNKEEKNFLEDAVQDAKEPLAQGGEA
ncbi:MDR family MFS transporter [Oenococcus kitaharae]|uniref:Permeases of the major facilitator superfamily n=1 Tax=Oenococcus kitaharae DSM 17330 TaxID=1045004 RepID=G9WG78_9LACO|nr:MDR family MFS transporter [Oenococcus kitaharae]EHN59686.1 Permeases of the major facilitator superfamily [Oenococcus kitaharae DSM 17330]OEY83520.1 multidrug transporter [Oenococcus kitaharae]OEY85319.1 multidrug transporter [Oenococcus kitaharae]OEY86173.1 multidrug transporter [Oenococcus kitaharae]